MNDQDLYKIVSKINEDKPITLARIFRKEYGENFISDWLAFLLNDKINGIGLNPLNIFMSLCRKDGFSDEAKILEIQRERTFDRNNRIDLLIHVKEGEKNSYIAIENKILSTEGIDQTQRYFEKLSEGEFEGSEKICIFLTPTGITPSCGEFKAISYQEYIEELEKIINDVAPERQFYFKNFIDHFKTYILQTEFTENECEFIKSCKDFRDNIMIKKNHTKEMNHCYLTAANLRNRFFKLIENAIKEKLQTEEWIMKKSSSYLQVYKEGWENYNIHYEIIIHEHKGLLYPGCPLLIMLHMEEGGNKTKTALRNELNFDKIDSKFNKPNNVLLEKAVDTKELFCSETSIKNGCENISTILLELIKESSAKIDNHVATQNSIHSL